MRRIFLTTLIVGVICSSAVHAQAPRSSEASPSSNSQAARYAVIPPGKDSDIKLYGSGGEIVKGAEAIGKMQQEAQIILWLAGNQFFAMDDVVHAFQKQNPNVKVGLITLPPGLILNAIQKGGWSYGGVEYPGLPDVYASVNLQHLKTLKQAGLMDTYVTYMHNEMVLMVTKGNPKRIMGIKDLVRPDVHTSLPNPVNEGIMQFYGRRVLERYGLWQQLSAGKECFSCQTTPNNWFTAVHHRETPDRIRTGLSDVGIVWKTEAIEATREGADTDSVILPPEDSLRDEVSYAIGVLSGSPRKAAAMRYLAFLSSREAQGVYVSFGFVAATAEELKLKPIP